MKKNATLLYVTEPILFLFFFILPSSLAAQSSKLDSLLTLLPTMKEDSNKVNAFHSLVRIYTIERKEWDVAEEYTQKQLLLAQKLNFKRGIARAYLNMGSLQRSKSNVDTALYYDTTALKIMREAHDRKGEGSSLINIGLDHSMKANYKEAIFYLKEAIQLEESIHEKKDLSLSYTNLATVLQTQGNYEEAMRYNLKSLKISEEIKDKVGIAMSYINIGVLYDSQKKIDQALGYYLKAIQQLDGTENTNLGNAFNNIGNVYLDKSQYQKALYYYMKALKVREKNNDKRGAAMLYNNIGNVYLDQDQVGSASVYHIKAYTISKQIGDKRNSSIACNSLGNTYEKKKNYDSARFYYQTALAIAREINFKEGISDAYENFSSLYKKEKQYDKALEYMLLFKEINDSSLNEASLRQINELTTRYETEKKEQEILLLTKDQELKAKIIKQQRLERWGLIAGLCLLSISVVSIYWRYRYKQKANEILERQKKEIEQTVQELTLAQDELNKVVEQKEKLTSILAHDLRTPLRFMSTISEYLYKNVSTISQEELKELGAELSTSSKSTFAFADEILTWLGIQKQNYKLEYGAVDIKKLLDELCTFFSDIAKMKGTQIKVETLASIHTYTDERLLKIILRNIIDNAIKYTNDGVITLSVIKVHNEKIEIEVTDTGEGMTQEQLKKLLDKNMFGFPFQIKDKLGFQIVRDLAVLIDCDIQIESERGKGTSVMLSLQCKTVK